MCNKIRPERCVIFCASPEFYLAEMRPDDYVIACDGGYAHAIESGVRPDLVVGDFDSYDGRLDPTLKIVRVPCEKDDTDTMLAIKIALEDGYRDFMLLGATGGRLDHLLSNVSSGAYIAEHGGRCVICDKYNVMHVIKDCRLVLRGLKGQTLSVLSYTDESKGVTLSGMKYPLENGTLTNAFPIGQSNIVKEDVCSVEVKHGVLLVIEAGMAH